jgi:spore germination protein GerM
VGTLIFATAADSKRSKAKRTTFRSTIYFLTDTGAAPIGVRRTVKTTQLRARGVLQALLTGPTPSEAASGITTALPKRTRLRTLTTTGPGGTTALVDLTGVPAPMEVGSVNVERVLAQVARSLIGVSGIERVRVNVGGSPWNLWDHRGRVRDIAIDYRILLSFYVGGSGDSFKALP